jgi:hypothetical protein
VESPNFRQSLTCPPSKKHMNFILQVDVPGWRTPPEQRILAYLKYLHKLWCMNASGLSWTFFTEDCKFSITCPTTHEGPKECLDASVACRSRWLESYLEKFSRNIFPKHWFEIHQRPLSIQKRVSPYDATPDTHLVKITENFLETFFRSIGSRFTNAP